MANPLPVTKAERVGMSAERLDRITQMTQKYVDEGKLAGAITMVARDGKLVHFEAVGNKGVADPRPLEKDDLFRIYSMTKPITATAAMQLYEQGEFHMNDPVHKFIPEFKDLMVLNADGEQVSVKNHMTMQQLLSHTAGMSYGFDPLNDPVDKLYMEANLWDHEDLDSFIKTVSKLPLKFEPGNAWNYSIAVDVTGAVVERISGQSFDEYLQEHIFDPLDMDDTFFQVPADKKARFLPNNYWDPQNNKLVAMDAELLVQTGALLPGASKKSAMFNFDEVSLYSGGGGLVSSAMDYLKFAEMMRNGGELGGVRILGEKTVKYMAKNHLAASNSVSIPGEHGLGTGFGLGFGVIADTVNTGVLGSNGEFSWGGAAGTIFWIDPVEELVVVGMIQLMGSPWTLRSDLKVATYQAITDSYD
ncbi:MAG: serine hydrolase [Pseudomonadales bacterium]|nr:serine hydrolase [Pseudomonadales bacterium]